MFSMGKINIGFSIKYLIIFKISLILRKMIVAYRYTSYVYTASNYLLPVLYIFTLGVIICVCI